MDGKQSSSKLMVEYNPSRTSDDCGPGNLSSPGDYSGADITAGSEGDGPGGYFENHGRNPRALESGYLGAAGPATRTVPQTQQFPQYYRDEARKMPVRDTMRSRVSGATEKSELTTASGTPMLLGITKSAFDEDDPKPKRKFILCGIRKSNVFVLIVLVLFLLVAGAAVGVGVGMSKTSGSSPYPEQTNYTTSSTSSATTPTMT